MATSSDALVLTLRPINPAETPAAETLLAKAFEWPHSGPQIRAWRCAHTRRDLQTTLGAFHAGVLVGFMEYQPVRIQVGRRAVPGAVAANLAVHSDWRRRRIATRLMERQLAQLNDNGIALWVGSVAQVPLMRSLGWEFGSMVLRYELSPGELADQLRDTPTSGRAEPLSVANIPDLDAVYHRSVTGRFGTVVRTRSWWMNRILTDPTRQHRRELLGWTSIGGDFEGYAVIERQKRATRIVELHALTRDAYVGLLKNLAQATDTSCLRWSAPIDDQLPLVATQPYRLHPRFEPDKMFRIVHVGTILEAALSERLSDNHGDTPLTVSIRDDHAVWNARTWRIGPDHGDGIKVVPVDTAPAATSTGAPAAVPVDALAAMISGLPAAIHRDRGKHQAAGQDDVADLAATLRRRAPAYCREDL